MRRVAAFLALAFFLGTPVMRWHCVMSCAADEMAAPATVMRCHRSSATSDGPIVRDHDCDQPSTPVALVTSARPIAVGVAFASATSAPVIHRTLAASVPSAPGTRPPGGPPHPATPLRI